MPRPGHRVTKATMVTALIHEVESSPATIRLIVPSPSNDRLALATIDGELVVTDRGSFLRRWDMAEFASPLNKDHTIHGVEFFPGENRLLVSAGTALRIFSLETGRVEWEYQCPNTYCFLLGRPMGVGVRADGAFAACFTDGAMRFWDKDGNLVWERTGDRIPRLLRFCSGGQALIGAEGFELSYWDADTGEMHWCRVLSERIHALEVDELRNRFAVRTLRHVHGGLLTDGVVDQSWETGTGLPTLALRPEDGLIAFGGDAGVRVIGVNGADDFFSVDAGVVSLAFSQSELWVGDRHGALIELQSQTGEARVHPPEAVLEQAFSTFASQPQVNQPSEPLWPVSMAYGGIICGLGAAVIGLLGHSTVSARGTNVFDLNYGWSMTILGLILGGLAGLVYGILVGDRKL